MKELTKEERELLTKYREKLAKEFGMRKIEEAPSPSSPIRSVNYLDFKRENLPKHLSIYEKLCNFSGRIVKVNPDKKSEEKLRQAIELCHLETTPGAAFSLSLLVFIAIFVVFGLVGFLFSGSIMFFVYSLVLGLVILLVVLKVPELLGNNWRLKASNQMVQCIFYLVTYMRHTSNLELAVRFASEHLSPPLSLDLKKVLWDVETAKYETVQESLDTYLKRWNDYNPEFTESVHLIEGSLYESSEQRRLSMIDKSLDVMLQETYEKMLRYTHDLKGPITMLYMMGIILPILGLVILPLVASFMTTDSSPMKVALVIALLYNIALPAGIFYMARMVLSKRPTGYGETDLSEQPSMKKLRNLILHFGKKEVRVSPLLVSITLGTAFLLIGLT
ncbi:hypothetical protein JXB11_00615, partial [Candidatus Woesearchaeota archaeon]|nr:hypothetical protein [Candidatus Woesearchaeota archaeon]